MRSPRGFTIIELIITMTVMVILMALAIVNLRGTQANGRDAERSSDTATIARGLEQRYNLGIQGPDNQSEALSAVSGSCSPCSSCGASLIPIATLVASGTTAVSPGSYPSTDEITQALGKQSSYFCTTPDNNTVFITNDLPGTDTASFKAPNSTDDSDLAVATSTSTPTVAAVGNTYLYQPLTSNGSLCTGYLTACTHFNLYYASEVSNTLVTLTSKHQQ